ncbi:MAG: hypothetical protein DWQ29_19190 [Planctomycetota bacterium]|nr:MAG: hypothetical protein DWQ29_19190 [Planctomycetota bacterium]
MASLSSHLDRADLSTLPLPLAQLLRRVQNAKTPHERHQAAFYFWEASLKLMAAVAVSSLGQTANGQNGLEERLQVLRRPALGHWWELLRTVIASESESTGIPLLADLKVAFSSKRRTDLPRLAGLNQFLQEALQGRSSTAPVVNLNTLIDSVIQYRNREIGHGALGQKSAAHYERGAAAFAAAGLEFATAAGLGRDCNLRFVADVRLLADRRWQADQFDLTGESPHRKEPFEPLKANGAGPPLPRCVYLSHNGNQDAPLLPLYPFLTYDDETQEVAFYNGARGRHLEFLGYTTGVVTRTEMVAEALCPLMRNVFDVSETDEGSVDDVSESSPAAESEPDEEEDQWIGDYQLISRLDSGGMGVVYRAYQPVLNRDVALKCLVASGDPRAEARFTREIKALGRVDHPHLVKIYSSGVSENRWFYAMELIRGANVASICDRIAAGTGDTVTEKDWREAVSRANDDTRARERPLTQSSAGTTLSVDEVAHESDLKPSEIQPFETQGDVPQCGDDYIRHVVRIARQVAEAVHALHRSGVIHRDIKPANIMVTGDADDAVLMDLGLAQMMDDAEGRLTRTRQFVGTLRYASPEQVLAADQVTVRSDVYSLGATLWELLTLRPLFGAGAEFSTVSLMQSIQFKEPTRPRKYSRTIPSDLEAIVMRCLEKDPARRYADAQELARDLARWERHEVVHAQPLTMRYFARKYVRRHRRRITLIAAAVCLLVAGAIGGVWKINNLRRQAEMAQFDAEVVSADLALQRGIQLCESGDAGLGMLWLSHALQLAPEESALNDVIRTNLASWSGQLPHLAACLEHEGWVRCLAVSPDGRLLATGSEDGSVRVWTMDGGELAAPVMQHGSPVRNIAFSPDAGRLYAAAEQGLIQTWDLSNGRPAAADIEHPGKLRDLALSPDGEWLLTGGNDGVGRLWSTSDGTLNERAFQHGARINAVGFSGDGQRAITAGHDGLVRVWNVEGGEAATAALDHGDAVLTAAISADGSRVLGGTFAGIVSLWNLEDDDPQPRTVKHGGPVGSVQFGPDGKAFLTGSWDSTARFWSTDTLAQLGPPLQHRSQVYAVAVSPDRSFAITGCWDNVARLWALPEELGRKRHAAHSANVRALAAAASGEFLVSGGEDGLLRKWSLPDFDLLLDVSHDSPLFAGAVSPDGAYMAAATRAGDVFVYLASDGRLLAGPLVHGSEVYSIAFSGDGKTLLTGCYDEQLRLWRLPDGTMIGEPIPQAGRVQCVAAEPGTGRFATAAWEGLVRVYEAGAADIVYEVQFDSPVTCASFHATDGTLAVSTQGGLVSFLNRDGELEGSPLRPDGLAWTVEFHPELPIVLTGTMGGAAQIWDAETRRRVGVRFEHDGALHQAVFLPGRAAFAVGSSDGGIYIDELPQDVAGTREQLLAWTQVMTGMELDTHGVARLLGGQEWTERLKTLKESGGRPAVSQLKTRPAAMTASQPH